MDLGLNGFLIAYYAKLISDFCFLLYFSVKWSHIKFVCPKLSEIFKETKLDIIYALHILLGNYGEMIGVETMSIIAA